MGTGVTVLMNTDQIKAETKALVEAQGMEPVKVYMDTLMSLTMTLGKSISEHREILYASSIQHLPIRFVRDIIAHEVAHQLTYDLHGDNHGHDVVWQSVALRLGAVPSILQPYAIVQYLPSKLGREYRRRCGLIEPKHKGLEFTVSRILSRLGR